MSLKYLIVTVIIASVVSGENQMNNGEQTTQMVDQTTLEPSFGEEKTQKSIQHESINTTTEPNIEIQPSDQGDVIDEFGKHISKIPQDLLQQWKQIFNEPLRFFIETFFVLIVNWIVIFTIQFIPCARNLIFLQYLKAACHFLHVNTNEVQLLNMKRREQI